MREGGGACARIRTAAVIGLSAMMLQGVPVFLMPGDGLAEGSGERDVVLAYIDHVARRVAQQPGYAPLVGGTRLHVRLKLTIVAGGQLRDAAIDLSSGDAGFDQAALALVRDAQPFGALPPTLAEHGRLVFVLSVPLP